MTGESPPATPPVLDDASRAFVRRSLSAGVVTLDEVKTVVASLLADSPEFTPQRLADGLVGAGILTKWQANKLIAGKGKGFFLGTYKLLRPLGKGGMGMVYLGEHHVMKRQMALKILPSHALRDKRRIERFKEEARASAQLDHSNIVRAYDFNESGGKLYIVMEYVDGIDLHQAVVRDGVMAIPAALDAIYQAASGLAHAHERGIIHRDIKPSNLMLRSDGVIKVSDMGLARIGWGPADGDGDKRRLTGTADFIAPEQALNSKTVDARADIYSLGCTFYFLLTAKPPYQGQSMAQRLAKHQTAPIPDVRKLRKEVPAPIAQLISRMLAKKPADRPASAVELRAQLERLRESVGKPSGSQHSLSAIASLSESSDTIVDDKLYRASIEDTSFADSSHSDQPIDSLDDFDFGSLPPASAPAYTSSPNASRSNSAGNFPPNGNFPAAGTFPVGSSKPALSTKPGRSANSSAKDSRGSAGGDSQMVLLGIGLTVAVLALLVVVGMSFYTLTRPEGDSRPKLKTLEDGKGGVIVIQE